MISRKELKKEKKKGDFFDGVILQYLVIMIEGKGRITVNDNKEFPSVKPISIEQFIKSNPTKTFGETAEK